MKTAAEYRAMAEVCFKWAREAKAKEERVSLRQLAQVWLDAASKLDGLPERNQRQTPRKWRRPEQSAVSDCRPRSISGAPKIPKSLLAQFRIAGGVLDGAMAEPICAQLARVGRRHLRQQDRATMR
jgi:hypothetical protein